MFGERANHFKHVLEGGIGSAYHVVFFVDCDNDVLVATVEFGFTEPTLDFCDFLFIHNDLFLRVRLFGDFDLEVVFEILKEGFTVKAFWIAVFKHPGPNGLN